jgi:hypothetical protein
VMCQAANKQLERSYVVTGAPQVRHFIVHMRALDSAARRRSTAALGGK